METVNESTPPAAGEHVGQGAQEPTGGAQGESQVQPSTGSAGNAADWRESFSEDLKSDPSIGKFQSVEELAKGYVNAQKLIGADKVAIPDKHATEDDWKAVYKKFGLPDSVENYELKVPEGSNDEFFGKFKEQCYQHNILPKQAQAILDWYQEAAGQAQEMMDGQSEQQRAEAEAAIKKEFGQALEPKRAKMNALLKEVMDEEDAKFLDEGMGNDLRLFKFVSKLADKVYSEDTMPGQAEGALTPKEAQSKIDAIYGNPDHPIYKSDHPGHESAKRELTELFKYVNG